jgi:hypothetical protein
MAVQAFVAKTPAKAKPDSAETVRVRRYIGIILQVTPQLRLTPGPLQPHSFVILRPANPDYTSPGHGRGTLYATLSRP